MTFAMPGSTVAADFVKAFREFSLIVGEQFVLINPSDADGRNLNEGDKARIFNSVGEFVADARVTDDVSAGAVVATFGYWGTRNQLGGAANSLTENRELGFAGTPHYYDTLVEIEKYSS